MNHGSISAYFSKLGYIKFDFAIFASEVGAFLSWIGVLTEVANVSQSATLTAFLWVVTRRQRVILGGILGRFVDRSRNRLRLMTLSMLGYSIFLIIPHFGAGIFGSRPAMRRSISSVANTCDSGGGSIVPPGFGGLCCAVLLTDSMA